MGLRWLPTWTKEAPGWFWGLGWRTLANGLVCLLTGGRYRTNLRLVYVCRYPRDSDEGGFCGEGQKNRVIRVSREDRWAEFVEGPFHIAEGLLQIVSLGRLTASWAFLVLLYLEERRARKEDKLEYPGGGDASV